MMLCQLIPIFILFSLLTVPPVASQDDPAVEDKDEEVDDRDEEVVDDKDEGQPVINIPVNDDLNRILALIEQHLTNEAAGGKPLNGPSLMPNMARKFEALHIMPDIVDVGRIAPLNVSYCKKSVDYGNEMTGEETQNQPTHVIWPAETGAYYTLLMTDVDAEHSINMRAGEPRESRLWLMMNIYENDLSSGRTVNSYKTAEPHAGNGLHRVAFLLYKQPQFIQNDNEQMKTVMSEQFSRGPSSCKQFAQTFNLGTPIAGNFFRIRNADDVSVEVCALSHHDCRWIGDNNICPNIRGRLPANHPHMRCKAIFDKFCPLGK